MQLLNLLSSNSWVSVALGVLTIACIVHVLTQRREYYWLFLLLFLPGIGAIIYVLVELLPYLRRRRVDLDPIRERLQSSDARIKARREALEDTDTLQNRVALASELTRASRLEEAEDVLRPLLTGIYRDDPALLYTLGDLKYRQGRYEEARALLEQVDAMRSQSLAARVKVLLAETYVRTDQRDLADRYYRDAMHGATSEEPRARYAQYLVNEGRTDEARALLAQMDKTYRRANGLYRSQEREWFRLADQLRQNLK
ncbi:tetratricopeptide repeat protein [Deinococcus pimensis]|uniref:tetratricopeptide repeat protein n=1 Tax=Deinococcus pimensis TaxID=309888 RepID=UPI0004899680|nr:tetratricopeptide repeat protein [Deinococcus pimensis]